MGQGNRSGEDTELSLQEPSSVRAEHTGTEKDIVAEERVGFVLPVLRSL